MAAFASVQVSGLPRTLRDLNQIADGLEADVKDLFYEAALLVGREVRPPRVSGRLVASVKATRTSRGAQLKVGNARVPYAPVIQYGWARRSIEPNPFMTRALALSRDDVTRLLEAGFARLFDPVGGV